MKLIKLNKEQKKKAMWILGWIFFFPAPLSVLIWKLNYNKTIKIILLILVWSSIIILGNIISKEEPENQKYKPTENQSTIKEEINKNDNIDEEKENKDDLNKIKTYKINTQEYWDYLHSLIENITINHDTYTSFKMRSYSNIYIKFHLYPNKRLSEEAFDKYLDELSIKIFNELKKNKYQKGSFFSSNYEIINVNFYNYDEHWNNQLNIEKTVQFYILELEEYDTFENYKNRNNYLG